MRSLYLAILAIIFLATPAFGAPNTTHGQDCDDDIVLIERGYIQEGGCINLCNNYAAADDAGCTEYKFDGLPHMIVLEKEENDAGCSADVTFTFTTGPVSGGTPSYALDTTAVTLNDAADRLTFLLKDMHIDSYLFIDIADDTGCTDVDVRMYLITEKD
jgi:hypothetical protein